MSSFSRAQALLQSAAEMARLIVELCDLRTRVQRAEAGALASGHVATRKSRGAAADLSRRPVAARARPRRDRASRAEKTRRRPGSHRANK